MSGIRAGYAFLLVLVCTYQDFVLQHAVGAIAMSPIPLLLPLLLLVELDRVARTGRLAWSPFDVEMARFLLLANVVGPVLIAILALQGRYDYLDEPFLGKVFKLNLYFGIPLLAFRHARAALLRISSRELCLGLTGVAAITFVVLVIEMLTKPVALGFLHGSEFPYNRIRLLTSEASTGGTVVIMLVAGIWASSAGATRGVRLAGRIVAGVLMATYTFASGSKGYVLVLGLSALLLGAATPAIRRSLPKLIAVSLVGAVLAVVLFQKIASNLLVAAVETTTAATRGVLQLAALGAPLRYPFGTGFGPTDFVLSGLIGDMVQFVSGIFPLTPANLRELDSYTYSQYGLHPKTGLGEFALFGGIPGLYLLWRMHRHLWRTTAESVPLRFGYTFMALSLATYITFVNKYDVWLFFAMQEVLGVVARPAPEAAPLPVARPAAAVG